MPALQRLLRRPRPSELPGARGNGLRPAISAEAARNESTLQATASASATTEPEFLVGRHYLLLGVAALTFVAIAANSRIGFEISLPVLYGVAGVLHALCVGLAISGSIRPSKLLGFACTAGLISAWTPALTVGALQHTDLSLTMLIGAAVTFSSGIGALLYWLLIRLTWLPRLGAAWGAVAVVACSVVSSAAWWGINLSPLFAGRFALAAFAGDTLPVLCWWAVLSLTLSKAGGGCVGASEKRKALP